MRYQLLLIFLTSMCPILVGGSTNKTPKSSQPNTKQKIKKIPGSESTPLKKKLSKNKKEESKTLIVRTALKHFVLTYSNKKVSIKGYQMDLSLDRKKCNAHIIDRFNTETSQIIREALKSKEMKNTVKKKEIDTVEIQIEGKSYFTKYSSKIGQTFLYYPKEALRMKWEEKFNCENKKKTKSIKKKEKQKSGGGREGAEGIL